MKAIASGTLELLELFEFAVRRTRDRVQCHCGAKTLFMLEILADEICRISMEESGGNDEDEA